MKKFEKIYYGGDYNPDQWPREIWDEDMRLFKLANVNIATLPVFSWAKLQPSEDEYDFSFLDEAIDLLEQNGIDVCLATSTAAQPAWMCKRYPEVTPVGYDGIKLHHGDRMNFCPNSEVYRKYSRLLAKKLAQRYGKRKGLKVWHIANEYGPWCYCDNCQKKFREWLKEKYKTIDKVNEAWNLCFWGHTVYDWDEIIVPSAVNGGTLIHEGRALDYFRFMNLSVLECFMGEAEEIRAITPDIPITTNLMGTYKPLDYFKWAKEMDVVSWDNYPRANMLPAEIALRHDLMRGLKQGEPFMLMEQTPSQQNWQDYNSLKKPGILRLWSYQAMAHGADTIMYFQLRRSRGGSEKYHGALIAHCGHENTRVFRECTELGEELKDLSEIIGSRVKAKVAILFDWDNWHAVDLSSGPSKLLRYVDQITRYYKAFYNNNITVELISPDFDLSRYDIVAAPTLYMIKEGVADNIKNYVRDGGTFVTTFFSGLVNETDLVTCGGYPGELRDVCGIWAEEIDALFPDDKNRIVSDSKEFKKEYTCSILCDLIHSEGAEVLAHYGENFYAGMPALTVNSYGDGKAYYVATVPDDEFLTDFAKKLARDCGIECEYSFDKGVEITERANEHGRFVFVLNHNADEAKFDLGSGKYFDLLGKEEHTGKTKIGKYGVMILKEVK